MSILKLSVVNIRSTADIAITLKYFDLEMSKGDDFKFSLPRRVTAGDPADKTAQALCRKLLQGG